MPLKYAQGFNQSGSLAPLTTTPRQLYNPRSPGPVPGRTTGLLDGHLNEDGAYVAKWLYADYLSVTTMTDVLTQLGLLTVKSVAATVQLPGMLRSDEIWNAMVHRNDLQWIEGRFTPLEITLYLIEYLGAP